MRISLRGGTKSACVNVYRGTIAWEMGERQKVRRPDDLCVTAFCWISVCIGASCFHSEISNIYIRSRSQTRRQDWQLQWWGTGLFHILFLDICGVCDLVSCGIRRWCWICKTDAQLPSVFWLNYFLLLHRGCNWWTTSCWSQVKMKI